MSTTVEEVIAVEAVTSQAKDENVINVGEAPTDRLAEAKLKSPPKVFTRRMLRLYLCCIVAFFGKGMNGFDGSLMSSLLALKPFQKAFGADVDGVKAGYITAIYQIGSVCCIPFIGVVMDKLGRRTTMMIGSASVTLGVILEGTSGVHNSLGQFLGGRFFIGFGCSLSAVSAGSYVAEISHPAYRGVLSSLPAPTYDIGSIVAAGVTRACTKYADNRAWIIPVWLQLVFSGPLLIGTFFIPESPRWNYAHGNIEKARQFIIDYHGEGDPNNAFVELQMAEFSESLVYDEVNWWDFRDLVRTRKDRYRLMNCLTFSIFGAWSSGGLGNYIAAFYKTAGITNEVTVLNFNLGYSFYSAFFAYLGSSLCNRVPRRIHVLSGLSGMLIAWIGTTVGTAMYARLKNEASANAGIAFYFLFSTAYGMGLTAVSSLYENESLSYRNRAKGISVATLLNSACGLVNQFATPIALQRIGWKTYIAFTIWVAVEIVWGYFTLVETRGFTLEEIDEIYDSRNPVKTSKEWAKRPKLIQKIVKEKEESV